MLLGRGRWVIDGSGRGGIGDYDGAGKMNVGNFWRIC